MIAGDPLGAQLFEVSRADLTAYAEASGDHNPIHRDDDVARSVGLPGVIAHGMLTLGLVGRAVDGWTGGAEVVELGAKFVAPLVVPPDEPAVLSVEGVVKDVSGDLVTLSLEARSDGTKVLGMPRAVVRLPVAGGVAAVEE